MSWLYRWLKNLITQAFIDGVTEAVEALEDGHPVAGADDTTRSLERLRAKLRISGSGASLHGLPDHTRPERQPEPALVPVPERAVAELAAAAVATPTPAGTSDGPAPADVPEPDEPTEAPARRPRRKKKSG